MGHGLSSVAVLNAAKTGNVSVIQEHLSKGGSIYITDDDNLRDLLGWAAVKGHDQIIDELLWKKVNVNTVDKFQIPAIYHAAEHGHVYIVQRLLAVNADITRLVPYPNRATKWTILHFAALANNKELIELLVQAKANVNQPDEFGTTPLIVAAGRSCDGAHALSALLAAGADVKAVGINGRTALHVACVDTESWLLVQVLLQAGAPMDVSDAAGQRCIHIACASGAKETVLELIKAKCELNCREKEGLQRSPLQLAIQNGHAELVKILIDAGAGINLIDVYRRTALHYAAARPEVVYVRLVMEVGGDIADKDIQGETPLEVAKKKQHTDVVRFLTRGS
eukprot:TRINITY_DN10074_c0_g1_i3.p1 TRINITY_DN10074_c0_g1~~TRINITY_DN10074_c0_g1_i3.p1  ORF type:complete len:338 (+),score=67.06 TRINITY_DN10074_c0_g1_i3:104-1117(+)